MTPDTPDISLAYATPSGALAGSLKSTVKGDFNAYSAETNAILYDNRRELAAQRQMIIKLDEREVGRAVAPTVREEINFMDSRSGRV